MDGVEIEAQHCFDNPVTIPMPFEAPVDGAILNTATGIVESLAELHYSARVNDVSLSGAFVASGVGQEPFPFVHLLGPTPVPLRPPRASQTHTLRFYLNGPRGRDPPRQQRADWARFGEGFHGINPVDSRVIRAADGPRFPGGCIPSAKAQRVLNRSALAGWPETVRATRILASSANARERILGLDVFSR